MIVKKVIKKLSATDWRIIKEQYESGLDIHSILNTYKGRTITEKMLSEKAIKEKWLNRNVINQTINEAKEELKKDVKKNVIQQELDVQLLIRKSIQQIDKGAITAINLILQKVIRELQSNDTDAFSASKVLQNLKLTSNEIAVRAGLQQADITQNNIQINNNNNNELHVSPADAYHQLLSRVN